MHDTRLLVNEIYKSKQGEGTKVGTPCVFLRLSHCDLKCVWCDTPYTWKWDEYDVKKESHPMGDLEVCDAVSKYDVNHLVITGGEPLLQQPQLIQFLTHLKQYCSTNFDKNFYVEIETNGTHVPRTQLIELVDQFNVSPKTSNSGNTHVNLKKIYADTLPKLNTIKKVWFKFVIDKKEDIDELKQGFFHLIDLKKVIFMPQGRTAEELFERERWLLKYCEDNNMNFSNRQHILEFGNKRGV